MDQNNNNIDCKSLLSYIMSVAGDCRLITPTLEPLENHLTATNLLLLKQTTIEEELLKRQQKIDELRIQAEKLK
ncbi:unnamed protein product [Rotaria sp. Silwood1]|nr:unnamed protein product [Rotaria sp. Silwood1]CAF5030162.1 unnamed protein product [Rotaria sp. Silwood1]